MMLIMMIFHTKNFFDYHHNNEMDVIIDEEICVRYEMLTSISFYKHARIY